MASYNGSVVGVVVSTFVLAMLFVLLRLVARRIVHLRLWWDDYFIFAAFTFSVAWSAIIMMWTLSAGLGRPFVSIDIDSEAILQSSRLYLWICQIIYAVSLFFSKVSILSFYWRLFPSSLVRKQVQILGVCSIIWLLVRILLTIFHCQPTQAYWDHTIEDSVCHIDESDFFFGTIFVHVIIDVCVLALPVVQVRRLKLKVKQKVAIILMFMFGILVCVAAVVVLVECVKFEPSSLEMPLNVMPIMICATVEINCSIISACLPMMRPILSALLPNSSPSTDRDTTSVPRDTRVTRPAFRLNTVPRNRNPGDADSTLQFVDDVECGSLQSDDYEPPHCGDWSGPQTFISGPSKDQESTPSLEDDVQMNAIHVRNKISVSYAPA